MASAQQVQEYLQKHNIGNLFEDLMAKVVSDMPDDPVLYLMQTLERKATRMGTKSLLRKSMGDLCGVAVAKDRPYTKPWQTNTKRQTKKKLSETDPTLRRPKTSGERPGWDNAVKGAETKLDDFWGEAGTTDKPARRRAASPTRGQHRSAPGWADDGEDEELLYRSQGDYTGPRRARDADTDPLSGELALVPDRPSSTKFLAPSRSGGRVRGPAVDAEKHRQVLARFVHEAQKQADSGYEDDKNSDQDEALELHEDADALMAEGVKNVQLSGIKVKPMRQGSRCSEPQVRVSICARCATVMDGAAPSEPAHGLRYGELPDFDIDTDGEFSAESRPQSSARYTDEEFESVSQVSGPRPPVWQTADSDNEALSPRKGQHMFVSSGVPTRGRRMFGSGPRDVSKSSLRATIGGFRDAEHGVAPLLRGHDAFNRTWTEGIGLTDDEAKPAEATAEERGLKEAEEDAGPAGKGVTFREDDPARTDRDAAFRHQDEEEDEASMNLRGTGWAAPGTDVDSDFTVPPARVSRTRAKGRLYQGQY